MDYLTSAGNENLCFVDRVNLVDNHFGTIVFDATAGTPTFTTFNVFVMLIFSAK